MLEERVLLAAQPVTTISSDPTPLVGEQAHLTVTFQNQPDGSGGSDVGYAPYVDLVLPQNGADGAGVGSTSPNENDGVTFVGATYLGQSVQSTVLEFDANGQATHPFAKDASGNLRVVNAADYGASAGDQLVVMRLPFGSFVPSQPAAAIDVTVQVSNLADVDTPLPVSAVGGFALGRDATDNPTTDAPVLGATASGTVTPKLLTFDKVYNGPEGETTTGPNFPRSFTVSLDIAAGQTLTNATFTDLLPDGLVVVGAPVLSGLPGTASYDPIAHTVTATLNGSYVGVAGVDGTLTITFYIGETMAPGDPGTPVLDPATGAPRTLENNVTATVDWTPIDTRDAQQTITIDEPGPEATVIARSIATQKTQVIEVDAGAPGLGPGDTLRYTIDVQISDYFQFQGLTLTDLMSDGQSYVDGSATLLVFEGGSTAGSGNFTAPNIVVTRDPMTGVTTFRFLVSDQLLANGAMDALLTGGEFAGSATVLRISYEAVIGSTFLGTGQPVVQGDSISNSVSVGAEVVDGGTPTGNIPDDTSQSGGTITTGSITKVVYAINGTLVVPGAAVEIGAGDLVTYRIKYDLPQSLADDLILTDYLPLPIFTVAGLGTTIAGTPGATPPAENVIQWGPDAAAFLAVLSQAPLVTIDAANNSFAVEFLDLYPGSTLATSADLLFTVRVIDAPFGDGLLMTNTVQGVELTPTGTVIAESAAITTVTLTEPELRITKGIVATDNPAGIFSPGAVAPVVFNAPGSAGVRFIGTIDSTNLAATPIDSNLGNVDAGDLVTFAVVIENRGRGINGAFDIRMGDDHPDGYVIPPLGLNLQVTDGAGNALAYILTPTATGAIVELIDPVGRGALASYAPTGGANIVVITYDLLVTDLVEARSVHSNLAEVENYAAVEGGVDRVPTTTEQTTDTAETLISDPTMDKQIVDTSLPQTGSSADNPAFPDLNIGETITFDLTVTLQEGRLQGFIVEDRLPVSPGRLDYVTAQLVSIGSNLFAADGSGAVIGALGPPTIDVIGNVIRFTFADDVINVPDNVVSSGDRIVLRVTAVAADVPGNAPGVDLVNTAALMFTASGQVVTITDTATAEIVGPAFILTKDADRDFVQGNDIVTYTVTYAPIASNTAGPVFDAILTDPLLPGLLTLVSGSAFIVTGPAGGATISEAGGVITVTAPVIMPGETVVITYQALVSPTVLAGSILPNTASGRADSFPGTNPLGVEREFTQSATATVQVPGPGIAKTVVAADTSLPETGSDRFDSSRPDLAIGEVVTYRIVVTLPEAVTQFVTFADYLPLPFGAATDGLFEFLDAQLVRTGSNITISNPGALTPVDRNGDGIADGVEWSVGTATNAADGIFDARDQLEFTVTARVRDDPSNRVGNAPINTSTVTFDTGGVITSVSDTAQVDIVEPNMAIDKTASAVGGDGGDRIDYTVVARVPSFQDGPAYDVVLTDTVPEGMEIDPSSLTFIGATLPGATLAYNVLTRQIVVTVPVMTYEGGAVSFAYSTIVANTVRPDQILVNTASVIFDSHPGDPGTIYQRDYGPVQDSENFIVSRPVLTKAISGTDIASTRILELARLTEDVAVGETVTYLISVAMPEVTTNLVLTDILPIAMGANPIAGDMEWISSRIVSIGANLRFGPGGPSIGDVGVVSDTNGDGLLDTIIWNLGFVTNLADNAVTSADILVFEVEGRVVNRPSNAPGDQLTNSALLEYTRAADPNGLLTASASVEIVSPELTIDKAADIATGDAGDIVTYTVTITHDQLSTSDGYNLVLTDTLAPGLQLVAGSVTATLANSLGTFSIRVGNGVGDMRVEVALSQLSEALALADGVLTVTYQARLTDSVRHDDVLTNTASLTWQSAPLGFPEARPDSATDTATVTVVLAEAIEKTVVDTSLPETTSAYFDPSLPDLAIGETVTYEIRLTLGEGTQKVLVADALPAGLDFVSGSVVSIGSGISNTSIGVGAIPVLSGGQVTFDFGAGVVNTGNNIADDGVIVMRVVARVLPGVNVAGDVLTNQATFTTDTRSFAASTDVEVVAPEVTITKTASITTGDAGDLVTFTVTLMQTTNATAPLYDLTVADTLPAGYVLVAGSATASRGTVGESGNTVTLTLNGAALLPADDPTTAGIDESAVTITYSVRLADTVQPGQVITNTAVYLGATAPGGGPTTETLTDQASAIVTVAMPVAIDKQIVATSLPETGTGQFDPTLTDLAQGESVTYRIVATLSEGTQTLLIEDLLPGELELVSAAVTAVGAGLPPGLTGIANSGTGQQLRFDFGTVVNTGNNNTADGTVTIEVVARVRDASPIAAGTVLTNAAQVTIASPDNPAAPGGTQTATDSTSAEIVAPEVTIVKSVDQLTGDAGDRFTYTVTVQHAAGSSSAAYDLVVEDVLDAVFVPVSVSSSAGTATISGNVIRVTLPSFLTTDAPVVVTYVVAFRDTVQPGQVVGNTATLDFDSSAGTGGIPGSGQASAQDVTGVFTLDLSKAIIATSLPETGMSQFDPALTDLAVGETVTYQIVATLAEGTQTLVVSDTLPAGLELLSAAVTGVGAGLPGSLASIANTGTGQGILFDFGTVVNTGNNIGGDGTVTITVVARVLDIAGNQAGTVMTNAAQAVVTAPDDPQRPGGTLTDDAATSAEIVEPELVIDKTAPPGFVAAGETILYTVTLTHQPGSTSAAYDVVLQDLLADPYLDLVAGSVTTNLGTIVLGNGAGDSVVRVEVPVLALGQTVTVTFTARVAADAPGGVTLTNTVTDTFDSNAGAGGRPDGGQDSTQTPGAPSLVKQIVATSNPDTGTGQFNPVLPDLAIGETLTYRLTITLPQGTTENLVLADLLPASLQPLAARLVSVGSGLTAGAPLITINGQSIALAFGTVVNGSGDTVGAEDQITIEIDAQVIDASGISAGDTIINDGGATFTIGGRDGTLQVTAPAELVEPVLDIVKQVDVTSGDAGDLFTYTVTITHDATSTAAAYDLLLTDTLDARFVPVSVTASVGTAEILGNQIRLTVPRLLVADAPITLTYVVRFTDAVEQGQVIGNTAQLGWDSKPGTGGRPDAGQASAPDLTVVFNPTLTKEIVATSLPQTGSDRFDPTLPDLEIGEVVTYELVVTLSEGTQNLLVTDRVPGGLLAAPFTAFVVSTGAGISAGAGGTLTPSAIFAGDPVAGQTITFDFGTIVNSGDNVTNAGDQIVIRISAVVIDVPLNVNGRQVINAAQAIDFSPSNPGAPGGTITLDASAAAEIVVPRFLLDKTVDHVTGDAGDVFTYTLTVSPAAGTDAPAYDLLIEDALSPFLVVVPGSLTSSAGTATIFGNMIRVEVPVMLPDAAPIIITYRAAFADAIQPGQIVPNVATLDYASAPNLAARNFGDDAEASVRAEFVLGLTKDIVATSLPETGTAYFDPTLPDVAAGETVTFHITATLSEGTQRLVITDTLPPGLIAESARLVGLGAGIAAGAPVITITDGRVVFDFGIVVNSGDNIAGDQIVVEIVARLNATPPAGTVLTNGAVADVTAPADPTVPGGRLTASDTASAEAVAAVLTIDKQVTPTTVSLGEPITYALILSHAPNSTAPAYEVVVQDPLSDASLKLVAGSVVTSAGTVIIGNGAGDSTIVVSLPLLMPGQVLTITFQARAVGVPVPDGIAPNTSTFSSTSAPGVVPAGFLRPDSGQDSAQVQIVSSSPPPSEGSLFADFEDAFRRIARNTIPAPTVLSGTAAPGASVTLGLINAFGEQITIVGVMADTGGNWIANPVPSGPGARAEDPSLSGLATLAGRTSQPAGASSLPALASYSSTPSANTAPFTVIAGEAPAAFDTRSGMDRLHLTFGGVVQAGGVFVGAQSSQGAVAAAAAIGAPQLTAPNSLAWNRFALDFAAATAAASVVGR
ncbi:isopeptide-forming domain-containing fimbrial protein [Roseomonas terrae]|uniref:Isopeptide-forming domain-containing fimbrial protein n=1 Tax=Neoroseomonas terrae TaxID=424799 RepID=A0ABS5EF19_9PROT|nr:isopeptide-forming domain-containing fimbrial protein [Neoroseomonas terrae]MBR0649618.1 isopeptide-forming domain-containing fimbrial protein [Neoroseomonas terrae]